MVVMVILQQSNPSPDYFSRSILHGQGLDAQRWNKIQTPYMSLMIKNHRVDQSCSNMNISFRAPRWQRDTPCSERWYLVDPQCFSHHSFQHIRPLARVSFNMHVVGNVTVNLFFVPLHGRHWSAVLISLCFPLSGRVPHGFYRATTIMDETIGWKTLKLQHRWLAARMRLFCTSTPHTMFPRSRSLKAHRSSVVIGDVCVHDRLLLERRAAGSSVKHRKAARNANCTMKRSTPVN